MFNLKETIHRRGFLGTIAASAATIGLASLATPLRLAAEPKLFTPDAGNGSFETWLNKINGKHKQVFDATDHHDGMPLAWTRVFQLTNAATGTPESDISTVLILRHSAIPIAMESRLWEKYKFGEVFKANDPATKAPSIRNMYYNVKPGDLPIPGMSVDELLKSGALLGVCDMALTFYSANVAKGMNKDAAEVKKDWVSGIFPGIQIVPSGVLAVNRTQEHGCTYCFGG
jgi:hypothetical protein